ncbi:MAG: SusC/RagA family protein [Porphyromonadaceae bacterium CG2_30_38_12]|nr:MAG: SusC/RagA family protein [Porphyromonadaceae bacterium CG2_30_38_12]
MYKSLQLKFRAIVTVFVIMLAVTNTVAQKIALTGVVKDAATGDPIIGANILEKGTSNGTITNFDGQFTFTTAPNATLLVKYVGYTPIEVAVGNKTNLVIQLKEDAIAISEVMVIGYGTVKKNDATGSVTAIKPDKINKGLTTNAQDMMTGKIAGVNVVSNGGAPGASSTIRIRGGASLNASNDPLIVVDGLALDNKGIGGAPNALSTINPNDIESFTVLKDASATAIYGSRASNGVIIITTKKGEKGSKPRISYDGNVSVSSIRNKYEVLSADQFRTLVDNLYKDKPEILSKLGKSKTDWQNLIYQNAISHDHNINIMGGFKNMPYRASVGYTNQNGIIKTSNFERYTGSINLSPTFFDNHLKVNVNAKGLVANSRFVDAGDVVGSAVGFDPTQAVTSDSSIYKDNFSGYYQWTMKDKGIVYRNSLAGKNPVSTLYQRLDKAQSKDFIGNVEFDYKLHFLPDLRLHLNLGYEASEGNQTLYVDSLSGSDTHHGRQGWEKKTKYNKLLSFYSQYAKELNKSRFDIMGGYEYQEFFDDKFNEYQGLESDLSTVLPDGTTHIGGYNYVPDSEINKYRLISFFGRANYSLNNKYLATASFRADATSHFADGHKWGLFPAAAFAWKLSEEDFLKDLNEISDLKFKLGYGATGQQDLGGRNDYYTPVYQVSLTGAGYPIGDNNTYLQTYKPSPYNPFITWETTTTYNVGIDYGFFKSRLTGSIDYYYRVTTDLINEIDAPGGQNFSNKVWSNIGSLNNKGIEFSVNGKIIEREDFRWEVGFNATHNENKITELTISNGKNSIISVGGISSGTGNNIQAYTVGQPANIFYVYQQVYDANNKPIEGEFVDRSGPEGNPDGIINDDDRYFYKKPTADIIMGLGSKVIYKDFDFSFSLRASIGNYMYNDVDARSAQIGVTSIYSSSGDGFLSNKPLSVYETNFTNNATNAYLSDYYIQNASFLRCDNISVGYSFKNAFKLISSGRIYATVQNPFVITKYKGLDPEVFDGIDRNIYPRPMISLVGISLNF